MRGGYYPDPPARRQGLHCRSPGAQAIASSQSGASFLRAAMRRGECPRDLDPRPLGPACAPPIPTLDRRSEGARERCFARGVDGVHVCPVRQEDRRDVDESRLGGAVQGCLSLVVSGVDIGALVEEIAHAAGIAAAVAARLEDDGGPTSLGVVGAVLDAPAWEQTEYFGIGYAGTRGFGCRGIEAGVEKTFKDIGPVAPDAEANQEVAVGPGIRAAPPPRRFSGSRSPCR